MTDDPLLSVSGASKYFGDITAVKDVSFDVTDGEFVTILGPSGSGKSTILRMIAGFEAPSEGTISIRGEDITDTPPFERDVNMVFQHLALFPHLTVEENISYGLKNEGVPRAERAERVDEMLDMVRLSGYHDRDPNELSGGEQQRVALARAMVNQPEIVLFDEPLASLDRKLRQHMQVELQRIQAETGTTFLYVTHDQEVSLAVADRLILLRDAEIEQIGTAEELYEQPRTRFVAEFIGDINSFEATVSDGTSDGVFQLTDREVTIDDDVVRQAGVDVRVGDSVDLCFRPHSIELVRENTDPSRTFAGTVKNRIYLGHYVTYRIETEAGLVTVKTEDDSFAIGDDVYAVWQADGTHFFPTSATTEAE